MNTHVHTHTIYGRIHKKLATVFASGKRIWYLDSEVGRRLQVDIGFYSTCKANISYLETKQTIHNF